MHYENTLTDLDDDTILPPLPEHVQEDFRRNYIVTSGNPHIAIWQMEGMGISTDDATRIYVRNWFDAEGNPLGDNQSPFAVTSTNRNLGYPVSFITDEQMLNCIGSAESAGPLLLQVRRLIAGHEMGHHRGVILRADLMSIGGLPAETANFMLDDDVQIDAVDIAAQRLTEVFCEGYGGLRGLRDEPTLAVPALNWLRKARMMSLWSYVEDTASKRTSDLPRNLTQYAIHQVYAGLIEHSDELLERVKDASDDDLAEMAFEGTRVMYPIIEQEALALEGTVRRNMQTPRGRDRMRRALAAIRKHDTSELHRDDIAPHAVLEVSIHLEQRAEERRRFG